MLAPLLNHLASQLTDRDYTLLHALHTYRVLTSHHVATLFYAGQPSRLARRRLLTLHRRGVLDRFRPTRPHTLYHGSAPWHWLLAPTGAQLLAHHRGISLAELGYRHDHTLAIAHSSRLAHTTGVLDCMVAFLSAARATGAELATWWDEARAAAEWGRYVRPDAYLRWRHDQVVDAFLEYDTGTEPLARVTAKINGYARLAAATNITTPVLFCVPTPERETNLANALALHPHPAAPTYLTSRVLMRLLGVAEPIWRTPHAPTRVSLTHLAPH